MQPIKFKEANTTLAENQPEYLPLPVYYNNTEPEGRMISCWQLTWRERVKLLFTGKLWFTQLTFHQQLQPQLPAVDSPWSKRK